MIKQKFIKDRLKLDLVNAEFKELKETLDGLNLKNVEPKLDALLAINTKLWKIEDDIRAKESLGEFDDTFIKLARAVYLTNDERFKLKREINEFYGSQLQEVKSFFF
ncbi:MAG: hypothetical protein ISR65_09780 [Bacteriovoracaceae bacterium]|nr:hypothetical protein [Bacteriovoracaceae bacterium]